MKKKYAIGAIVIMILIATSPIYRLLKVKTVHWIVPSSLVSDESIKEFNSQLKKDGYNFKLNIVQLDYKDYIDKLNNYLDSGKPADIILNYQTPDSLEQNKPYDDTDISTQFIIDGNFVAFDKFDKKDVTTLLKKGTKVEWDSVKYNNKIYAIPNGANPLDPMVYYFNNDKVKNIPTDIDKNNIEEAAKIDGMIFPYISRLDDIYKIAQLDRLGGSVFGDVENGNIGSLYNQEDFISKLKLLNVFNKKGYFKKLSDIELYKLSAEERQYFGNLPRDSELTIKYVPNSNNLYSPEVMAKTYSIAIVELANIRGVYGDKKNFIKIPRYIGSNFTNTTGIYSKSEIQEEAFKLLFLANTEKKYSDLLIYGIKGIDYEENNGVITKNDTSEQVMEFNFGIFYNTSPSTKEWIDRESLYKINLEAKPSPYIGFNFNAKGYEDIINKVNNIAYKNLDIWKSDNLDVELERVRKELSDAGENNLIEEINIQVKEWKNICDDK